MRQWNARLRQWRQSGHVRKGRNASRGRSHHSQGTSSTSVCTCMAAGHVRAAGGHVTNWEACICSDSKRLGITSSFAISKKGSTERAAGRKPTHRCCTRVAAATRRDEAVSLTRMRRSPPGGSSRSVDSLRIAASAGGQLQRFGRSRTSSAPQTEKKGRTARRDTPATTSASDELAAQERGAHLPESPATPEPSSCSGARSPRRRRTGSPAAGA